MFHERNGRLADPLSTDKYAGISESGFVEYFTFKTSADKWNSP